MTDTNATGGSQEAWSKLADQFTELADQFRSHYHRVTEANPPAADPAGKGTVERAVTKVGKAIEDTARTIDQSVRDPKVREDTSQAGSALLRAVGATLADLGAALQREGDDKKPADPPAEPASAQPEPGAPAAIPAEPTPAEPAAAEPAASAESAPADSAPVEAAPVDTATDDAAPDADEPETAATESRATETPAAGTTPRAVDS